MTVFLEPNTSEECVSQEELDGLWNNLELVSNDRKLTPDPPRSGFYYLHQLKLMLSQDDLKTNKLTLNCKLNYKSTNLDLSKNI